MIVKRRMIHVNRISYTFQRSLNLFFHAINILSKNYSFWFCRENMNNCIILIIFVVFSYICCFWDSIITKRRKIFEYSMHVFESEITQQEPCRILPFPLRAPISRAFNLSFELIPHPVFIAFVWEPWTHMYTHIHVHVYTVLLVVCGE